MFSYLNDPSLSAIGSDKGFDIADGGVSKLPEATNPKRIVFEIRRSLCEF